MGNDSLTLLDLYGIDLSQLQDTSLPQINFTCDTELVNGKLIKPIDDDSEYFIVAVNQEKNIIEPKLMVVHQKLVTYL